MAKINKLVIVNVTIFECKKNLLCPTNKIIKITKAIRAKIRSFFSYGTPHLNSSYNNILTVGKVI